MCTFISYLISYLRASEKIFNLQIYVCGMHKHFLKLCSKKPQKSSPEFSRLCGRPPLPSRGGGQHATVTHECVRQCVRLPSRAWCHQDSTHWLPSSCTSHSTSAPYPRARLDQPDIPNLKLWGRTYIQSHGPSCRGLPLGWPN